MGNKGMFKGTEEVYGVDPRVLAGMSYEEATRIKLEFAKNEYKRVAKEIYELGNLKTFDADSYFKLTQLDVRLKELMKAISLAELQLDEIGADYDGR